MVNINLHGKLGKEFENSWQLEVSSAAEILRALDVQIPNFREHITKNELAGHRYCVAVDGKKLLKEEEFFCALPRNAKIVDFLPVVGGGGPAVVVFLGKMLLAMAIGAITSLIVNKMFAPPDPQELKDTNSYLFAGAENTESQGIPVPIAYGKLLIGGKVISAIHEYSDMVEGGTSKLAMQVPSNALVYFHPDSDEKSTSETTKMFGQVFGKQRGIYSSSPDE